MMAPSKASVVSDDRTSPPNGSNRPRTEYPYYGSEYLVAAIVVSEITKLRRTGNKRNKTNLQEE